eukprot:XP_010646145.1 PREDICTED: heterogeneous nuclear ribonucleoprotein U-like protein 1 isoform X3 [Vitis vinifera]
MASIKRQLSEPEEPESKKPKAVLSDSPEHKTKQRVVLNPADCDLDFNIVGDGLQGSALHDHGFAYCWSGARGNVGITGGKYCFGCKIISTQPVDMEDTPPDQQHVCRLGISRGDDAVGNLGETEHSFGFGGTGKFSVAGKFSNYGEKFGVGDTIVCAVNLETKPLASISFSKNGKWLGVAKEFDAGVKGLGVVDSPMRQLHWESALFPHVLLKNVMVQVQFSTEEGLVPEEGYKPWASALYDGNAIMGPSFSSPRDCEVMMMVGLPASGKSTWAEKWVKEHAEKRYVLLGTNLALDQMKVPGLLRKQNYGERFERLMDRATGIFNTLLSRASKTPHNYIIDQTNVYKNARKRKLKPFANFQKIAVVLFPKPEELKFRAEKRFKEMGKEVPADAVNEMIANYVLPRSKDMPGSDEDFDQESSLQSYNSSSLQNQGAPSVPDERSLSYHPPLPQNYYYQRPAHMNSGHQGVALHGRVEPFPRAYQDNQNPFMPRDAPYETSLGYSRNFLSRNDSNSYGTYGYDNSRGSIPGVGMASYQSFGMVDPYRRTNLESRNPIPMGATDPYVSGMVESHDKYNVEGVNHYETQAESMRTSLFSHNTLGGHGSVPGGFGANQLVPRDPRNLPTPSQMSYGSPYGAPLVRPSYGNFPTDMQHPGGYAPPRPRYY